MKTRMNKIGHHSIFALVIGLVCICVLVNALSSSKSLFDDGIECLSECEIKNKAGKVIFLCVGEAGLCEKSYMGYTLTCTGVEKDSK